MTLKKSLLILNPTAGKGRAGERLPEIRKALEARGLAPELKLTIGPWHAAELAREASREGYELVIAAGGDGTANEVLNGLMLSKERGERPPVFGLLPVGRGNDFAFGLGLPTRLEEIAGLLAECRSFPLDVGRVVGGRFPEGRYFGNGIGVGFDTRVGLEAAKLRRVRGALAYAVGAAKVFIDFPAPVDIELEFDGGSFRGPCHQISLMNGRRMGGSFHMAPEAKAHDGLLDLCLVGEVTRREMASLILHYTKGTQAGHSAVTTGRSSRYRISAAKGGLIAHADGETVTEDGRLLEAYCLSGALSAIRPEDA